MAYYPAEEGTAIDLLPKHFRGIVVIGLPNGMIWMGLKGNYEDKESFKSYLPSAKWEAIPHTKAWLCEMQNSTQAEIFKGLMAAKKEMFLEDVAIEGCKPQMRSKIVDAFKQIGLI